MDVVLVEMVTGAEELRDKELELEPAGAGVAADAVVVVCGLLTAVPLVDATGSKGSWLMDS